MYFVERTYLMKLSKLITLGMMAGAIAFCSSIQGVSAKTSEDVSVKLSNFLGNKKTISLTIKGKYKAEELKGLVLNGEYLVRLSNNMLYIEGEGIEKKASSSLTLMPMNYDSTHSVEVNGRNYLGEMKLTKENGYIRPINTLPIEDYLKGVVPKEMPNNWHLEALKAQAVAARTYTYKHQNEIMSDTQIHQVYGGYQWSTGSTRAVNETKGEILTYKNEPINAYYSSSNGGHTEKSDGAWGGTSYPYLKAKVDAFDPQTSFTYPISETSLISLTRGNTGGVIVRSIDRIDVKSRTEGQYAKTIRFYVNSNTHSFEMSANTLRSRLNGMKFKSTNIHSISKTGSVFTFVGKGFGHGVGMSQYGAKTMGEKGYDYKEILGYYYEGTALRALNGISDSIPNVIVGGDETEEPKQEADEKPTKDSFTFEFKSSDEPYIEPVIAEKPLVTKYSLTVKGDMLRVKFKVDQDAHISLTLTGPNDSKVKLLEGEKTKGTMVVFYNEPVIEGTYTVGLELKNADKVKNTYTFKEKVGKDEQKNYYVIQ